MKICPKCNKEFESGVFCKVCGEKLIETSIAQTSTYEPERVEIQTETEEEEKYFSVDDGCDTSFHKKGNEILQNAKEDTMATWKQVRDYIQENYKYEYDEEYDMFKLIFEITDERSQVVFVERDKSVSGTSWIEVSSPVGEVNKNDIFDLLEDLDKKVCGGAVKIGNRIFIRSRYLLDSIDSDAIDNALSLLAGIADELEEKYVGGDES